MCNGSLYIYFFCIYVVYDIGAMDAGASKTPLLR